MKVLIIDDFHHSLIYGLKALTIEVDYFPLIKKEELLQLENVYDGIIVRSKMRMDELVLTHFSKVSFIARGGAGMDGIDEDYCYKRNISVLNAPEGNRDAVAEHTVAFILAFQTKMIAAHNAVKRGEWDREQHRGTELKCKTVGIIGYGNAGREVAKRLNAFGCQILAYDIVPEKITESYVQRVSLLELQNQSDIITVHVPFTKQTRHMVNLGFISQIKSSSLLVNMSRGEILDTQNVLQLLADEKFSGLCLDVIEGENKNGFPQLTDNTLQLMNKLGDKLLITPHVGGWTKESFYKIAEVLLGKITLLISDRKNEKK